MSEASRFSKAEPVCKDGLERRYLRSNGDVDNKDNYTETSSGEDTSLGNYVDESVVDKEELEDIMGKEEVEDYNGNNDNVKDNEEEDNDDSNDGSEEEDD